MDRPDHLGQPVITIATAVDADDIATLRHALWPTGTIAEHRADFIETLARPERWLSLVARTEDGTAIGFAQASIRHDYVNGCNTSPAGFLEGIYVDPSQRRTGLARNLVAAVEAWVRQQGCSELASDAALDNNESHAMHGGLGFVETQRVVYFRKMLG